MRPYGSLDKAQSACFWASIRPRRYYLATLFRRSKKVARRDAKRQIREESQGDPR